MLCIWWDQLGVEYYKLLNPSKTITGTLYRTQLMILNRALKEKRPQYYSRHDKPHPPYSPDIAPSDYHFFWSMAHALSEERFSSYEDTKKWVDLWIASKDKEFFRLEILTLPERWKKVVASDGQYFD
ncbi:Mariner Mos1 transposase [Eumeta japonica]|uniref:Mariner Mos1 transposase n=1 Tax=Eumeta variegata TaxID=151549 RepID=A0A4C1VGJ0_EUMVA|nr:Mariner Mos1 transposase [Eumeta japonica]